MGGSSGHRYDVVVVGGGPSGIAAALAAAREGAKTLLVERYGFLGGLSTAAGVYPWQGFHTCAGDQCVRGLAQTIVDRLAEMGASPGHLRDTTGWTYSVTPFDAEALRALADLMLAESGVDMLLHSIVMGVLVRKGRIAALETLSGCGRLTVEGAMFVDASGDGDLACLAGAPFELGRPADGLMQPMTMNFRMGGVRIHEIVEYMQAHPEEFHETSLISELTAIPLTGVSGFFSLWREHGPKILRDRVLFFTGIRPGEVHVNTSRVLGCCGTDARDMTRAEAEGRRQVGLVAGFLQRHVPGFGDSYLLNTAAQIGVRETRRLVGCYTLTRDDMLSGRAFPDSVCRGGYPIDIHDPAGSEVSVDAGIPSTSYSVPFRCLISEELDNLLVTGRAISVSHEALGATRVTPTCMALGEAAGTAAGLCVANSRTAHDIDVIHLQQRLQEHGAVI
ncbi:MAG TPA: FAD-dependent oxidoreductase [Firmicutes bacterium]|nr:FAD-dependent oxidoreductase [Bacillota bacterium]